MNTKSLLFFLISSSIVSTQLRAEDFALVSRSVANSLRAKIGTPAANAAITSASANLGRSPNAIAKIQTEGKIPHDPVYDKSKLASADLPVISDFALAYRLTSDRRYLDAAARFITAWVGIYSSETNPINDQDLYYLFLANDVVGADLASGIRSQVRDFARNLAREYLDDIEKHPASAVPLANGRGPNGSTIKADPTRINNFQSHRIKLSALAAFASGDAELIRRARVAFQMQIGINVYPDGTVVDFQQRDAIDYVTYDLDPLLLAAIAARAHGEDWFTYKSASGSSLEKAVDWLIPYANGSKTHEEFEHTTVPFDVTRRKAGVPGFSGKWNPKGATATFALASVLRSKYRKVLDDVEAANNTRTPRFIALCFE